MSTKQYICLGFMMFLSTTWVFCDARSEEGKAAVTKQDVVELLPTGPDMMDNTSMSNYSKLVELGPDAYPALADVLDEAEDPIVISRIFSVFVESQGDKTDAIGSIKKIFERFSGSERNAIKIQIAALDALGRIGSANDLADVYSLMESDNERVRINAMRTIGKIGNISSIEKIEAALERLAIHLSEDEKKKDYTFRAGRKAGEIIRNKLDDPKKAK